MLHLTLCHANISNRFLLWVVTKRYYKLQYHASLRYARVNSRVYQMKYRAIIRTYGKVERKRHCAVLGLALSIAFVTASKKGTIKYHIEHTRRAVRICENWAISDYDTWFFTIEASWQRYDPIPRTVHGKP